MPARWGSEAGGKAIAIALLEHGDDTMRVQLNMAWKAGNGTCLGFRYGCERGCTNHDKLDLRLVSS